MKTKNQAMVGLFGIGGILGVLSWVVAGTAKPWLEGTSTLALAAGLVIFLVGVVVERRALEARRQADLK